MACRHPSRRFVSTAGDAAATPRLTPRDKNTRVSRDAMPTLHIHLMKKKENKKRKVLKNARMQLLWVQNKREEKINIRRPSHQVNDSPLCALIISLYFSCTSSYSTARKSVAQKIFKHILKN